MAHSKISWLVLEEWFRYLDLPRSATYLKIGTWNLCLGLANKKELITDYLKSKNIKIYCLQETEIPLNYPENILNHNDYLLELEQNDDKKRVGIYISKDIKFKRRADLEKKNCHIVIIDVLEL